MTNNYTVAIYLRISEDDGLSVESDSIRGQRNLINSFIDGMPEFENTHRIEYSDDGYSGTNFERPGAKRMLEQIKQGKVNCVVVKDFSRFGRNYIEVGEYLEQIFPFLRVRFISINDFYDSDKQDSTAGDLSVSAKNLCNDYYSKDLSRKIKTGLATLRDSGKCLSPGGFFGYKLSDEIKYHLVVDKMAAAIVKRIFDLALTGKSTQEIASILNIDDVPTPMLYKQNNGIKRRWNTHTVKNFWKSDKVRCIIRDIRYTGALVYGKTRCDAVGSKKMHRLSSDEWFIIHDKFEAIISKDDFKRAQNCIKKKNSATLKATASAISPLAGKVRCGGCGYTLRKSRGKYSCDQRRYTNFASCLNKSVDVSIVEETIINALHKLFKVFDLEKQQKIESQKKQTELDADLQHEIQLLKNQINTINNLKLMDYNKYIDGEISKDEYLKRRDINEVNIKELSDKLSMLKEKQRINDMRLHDAMDKPINALSWDGKITAEICKSLIDRVFVYDYNKIEIKWNFNDSSLIS